MRGAMVTQVANRYSRSVDQRAAELIERLGVVRRAARRAAAAQAGLSLAQLDALAYLGDCNRFSDSPAAVADYLDTTRGTASQSLRALERKGLVTRSADPRDRRVQHLTPTGEGRRVLERAADDPVARAVAVLGHGAADVDEALERVLRRAQRDRGGRTFGRCATCAHLRGAAGAHACGLTGEPLTDGDTALLCVEHSA